MEAVPAIRAHEIKEENIADEEESAGYLTLSKRWRSEMYKTVTVMAPLCPIYDVNVRNLPVEHDRSVEENQSGEVSFSLLDHPYNVRWKCEDDHGEYFVLDLY